MSAATIDTRVGQIQQMLVAMQTGTLPSSATAATAATSGGAAAPDTSATSATSFATQLAAATAAGTPAATTDTAGDTGQYDALIQASATRNGVDPALLKGLIRQESGFDPDAGSSAGAQGLTQLMPGTASALGVTDLHDPAQSIEGGAEYLSQQLKTFGGDESKALAAYNAGPGAVQRYGGVPPYAETQQYVQNVLGYAAAYGSPSTTSSTMP